MLTVRLLGRPRLEREGVPVAGPRGHKAWALLARLVRSPDPVSRQTLVDELFSQADDPMAALRWTLAELRRRLGAPEAFQGDPLTGDLGPGIEVDVTVAALGRFSGPPPDGRFLERVEVRDSATFETWLLVERERVDAEILSGIREATLRSLARGEPDAAIDLARVMVARDPLVEGPHVLLVSALAAAGRADAAARQAESSIAMLRRELGMTPSSAIRDAAAPRPAPGRAGVSPLATAKALRASGLDAVSAGVAAEGASRLRAAAAAAEQAGDQALMAECLLDLGTALVHADHNHDDEGSVVLGSAIAAASDAGLDSVASQALSELAYVDVLSGRRVTASIHLEWSRELAGEDPVLLAHVASIEATDLHDRGLLHEARERYLAAIADSQRAGEARREAWALGVGARTLYWLGDMAEARSWVDRSLAIIARERWSAFRPWVEAWGAHVDLALGADPSEVIERLESTFALACELNDACWQGMSAKAMALAHEATGESDGAREWIVTAAVACSRETDAYDWVRADVALAHAELALGWGDLTVAAERADDLRVLAARCGFTTMLERAAVVLARAAGEAAATGTGSTRAAPR
ncbi:BTAD domain-containing putative transcriptional regulator [Demequina sp. NBRC 110056]|uniref:AfsR/SARP family transcriptional regulator n=1 Tax=Demequina sp. NBRC 110056 TaxID=1570345 RepID=UPI000A06270B|nr:BTAD domain-containing putative transcriptional regulator [Demequina sp. NBRC 110056]